MALKPRRLDKITVAEHEMFDRIWHHRSLHEYRLVDGGDGEEVERLRSIAEPWRQRVEESNTEPGQLGPYTGSELGMLHGSSRRSVGSWAANGTSWTRKGFAQAV
jgi:hypothetical protein